MGRIENARRVIFAGEHFFSQQILYGGSILHVSIINKQEKNKETKEQKKY